MKTAGMVLIGLGAFLILAGVIQVFVQMVMNNPGNSRRTGGSTSQSVDLSRSGLKAKSAYPGVWMVGIDAGMAALGAWLSN